MGTRKTMINKFEWLEKFVDKLQKAERRIEKEVFIATFMIELKSSRRIANEYIRSYIKTRKLKEYEEDKIIYIE